MYLLTVEFFNAFKSTPEVERKREKREKKKEKEKGKRREKEVLQLMENKIHSIFILIVL